MQAKLPLNVRLKRMTPGQMVLFGALADSLDAPGADWEEAVRQSVPPKFLELNLKAFEAGREAVKGQ